MRSSFIKSINDQKYHMVKCNVCSKYLLHFVHRRNLPASSQFMSSENYFYLLHFSIVSWYREKRDTKDTSVSRHMKIKLSVIYYLCSQKTAKKTRRNRIMTDFCYIEIEISKWSAENIKKNWRRYWNWVFASQKLEKTKNPSNFKKLKDLLRDLKHFSFLYCE